MKSKLSIMPFLGLFFVLLAMMLSSVLSNMTWLAYSVWGLAGTMFLAWVILDKRAIRLFFNKKGAKYGANTSLTLVLGLILITGIGFLSTKPRFNLSVDVTRDSLNTLSDQSKKVVGQFSSEQKVEVLSFFEDESKKMKFTQLLDLYRGIGLKVNAEDIDPKADPTRAIAENVTTVDTVILKYGIQNNRLTDFTEEKLTNSLLKLLKADSKKVYFTVGHGERSLEEQEADGFKLIQDELISERYAVETVNLFESGVVPKDADLVVIAGPKYDFHVNETKLLDEYMSQAGAVLFMVDAMTDLPNVSKLAKLYGISVNNDMLILRPDDPRVQLLGQNNALVTEFDEFSAATKDFAKKGAVTLLVPNARSLSEVVENEKGMNTSLVAKTADIIIGVTGIKAPSDLEGIDADRIVSGPFSFIAIAEGQIGGDEMAKIKPESNAKTDISSNTQTSKELRIAAVGSSDLVSNLGVQRGENVDMFLNLVNYLMQDDNFISIRPKDITSSSLDVSSVSSQLLLLFFAYLYPTMFLGGGVFYWMRRRRA